MPPRGISSREPWLIVAFQATVFALLILAPGPCSAGARGSVSTRLDVRYQKVLNHLETKRFQVIGGGPAGLMAFIRQYHLLKKLRSESATKDAVDGATITLYEKRVRTTGVSEPSYTRAQILRLDMHAIDLLKTMEYPSGAMKGSTVFERLFEGHASTGYCLDEIKQPNVLDVGYDNVKFGEKAGIFDPENTFCHIQTKKLEEALYQYARQSIEFDRAQAGPHKTPSIQGELNFGWTWKRYEYSNMRNQYESMIVNERTGKEEAIPFDVLISAQGACSGSPGRCAVSARQQMLHPGGITLGHDMRALDEARNLHIAPFLHGSAANGAYSEPGTQHYTPEFKGGWTPADGTAMSWGMTGFFAVELLEETPKVLLTTWNSAYHLERYGGPVQVRSFYNKDIHYIGLGISPLTVEKFKLNDPSSEHGQDYFFKFWEMIIFDFDGHPTLTREMRKDPRIDPSHAPQLFPIVLYEGGDTTAVLPPSQAYKENIMGKWHVKYSGKSALVTFQGDEARLPNFVTASGINWGYYGLDRGMSNRDEGCAGLYNMMKNFIRLKEKGSTIGAYSCLLEMNKDSNKLSKSLAARAQALASQFLDVNKPLPGGLSVRRDYSVQQGVQLQSLFRDYKAKLRACADTVEGLVLDKDDRCDQDTDSMSKLVTNAVQSSDILPNPYAYHAYHWEEFATYLGRIWHFTTVGKFEEMFRLHVVRLYNRRLGGDMNHHPRLNKCQERELSALEGLDLTPTYQCVQNTIHLPWYRFRPFTSRKEAAALGCNDFSFFACIGREPTALAALPATVRVLPDWASDYHCRGYQRGQYIFGEMRMVCSNIFWSEKYGWYDMPLTQMGRQKEELGYRGSRNLNAGRHN